MLGVLMAMIQYDVNESVLPTDSRGPDYALYKLKGCDRLFGGGTLFSLDDANHRCDQRFIYYANKDIAFPNPDARVVVAVTQRADKDGYFWIICSNLSLYKAQPRTASSSNPIPESWVGSPLEQLDRFIEEPQFDVSREGFWHVLHDA